MSRLQEPDLLAWPIVQPYADRARQTERALQEARRRFRLAPHGQIANRSEALQKAMAEALAAAVDLDRVLAETCQ